MMRSSIIGASTLLNDLIQHLPLNHCFGQKLGELVEPQIPASKLGELVSISRP